MTFTEVNTVERMILDAVAGARVPEPSTNAARIHEWSPPEQRAVAVATDIRSFVSGALWASWTASTSCNQQAIYLCQPCTYMVLDGLKRDRPARWRQRQSESRTQSRADRAECREEMPVQ